MSVDHYLVQRNTAGNNWETLTSIIAGGYTPGEYTLTGQLLFHTSLKGQTLYPIHLPAPAAANNVLVAQVIGNTHTQAFTLLNQ
jgi:hypothetical protein